ncbi:hypothetical protein AWM68_17725 [Fictibacillus phosphorivorans]|uniref:HTH cro/C1-type domain-containing protein n=1 Tax=Fictibacillus phosphorivorans TaxID=1221500 RepID=A0A161TPP7_9BACL|nr:helix-turn-helix domain-containing protein [Fictibacillus phosphorivorans]KZE68011.1 hypothetical protein AWM68_17725 [Fictibacillus phosphorivorans]
MDLSKFIKETRIKQGLTMRKLASKAQISQAYISQIERGERHPQPDILRKLAVPLDVPYNKLMNIAGFLAEGQSASSLSAKSSIYEILKYKPTLGGEEITEIELDLAINVIKSFREAQKKK